MSGSVRPAVSTTVVDALNGDATLVAALGGQRTWVNVPDKTRAPYLFVVGGRELPGERTFANRGRRQVQVLVTAVSAQRAIAS